MRGSRGVGVLVKNVILQDWSVKVINVQLEDVMWVKLEHKETSHAVFIAVCYFPPASWESRWCVFRWKVRLWCVVILMRDVENWVIVKKYPADVVWT